MQSIKDEVKLLAAILDSPEILQNCRRSLFTEERASIFDAMQKSYGQYGEITAESIEQFYKGSLSDVLLSPIPKLLDPLFETLARFEKKRKASKLAELALSLAQEDNPDLSKLQISSDEKEYATDLIDSSMTLLQKLQAKSAGTYEFISTGIQALDVALHGEWPRREISLVLANPGGSKSALVGNSILRMAKRNHASLFFSMEMSKEQLQLRWISEELRIDHDDVQRGSLTQDQVKDIQVLLTRLTQLPLFVIDQSRLSVDDMLPVIRKHVKQHDVHVVFIDHLQIMRTGDDKNKSLGLATELLKNIAKELNIHICIISQKNQKDGVWQVRDSGDVPANVDIIIQLTPTEDTNADTRHIMVDIHKNRNGRLGSYPTIFYGNYMSFLGEVR
jgi:replicative DNA helicase